MKTAHGRCSRGRIRFVIESYLRLLSRDPSIVPDNVLAETFGYADILRGQSVQRALQASSARSAAKTPELAQLVRTSQDTDKKIGAAVATLNVPLAWLTSERDGKALHRHPGRDCPAASKRTHLVLKHCEEIPDYGSGQPSSARFCGLANVLTNDEVLLSFHFAGSTALSGFQKRRTGPVQAHKYDAWEPEFEGDQASRSFEPSAAMISDILPTI